MTSISHNRPPPTVLLVEDHVDTRHMFAEFLRSDFIVLEAGDGVGALALMGQTLPDVVVTDLSLPIMTGFELVERMRADQRLKLIPVIALSGYSDADHESRALGAGVDLVLQKPCLPDVLARTVAAAATSRNEGR